MCYCVFPRKSMRLSGAEQSSSGSSSSRNSTEECEWGKEEEDVKVEEHSARYVLVCVYISHRSRDGKYWVKVWKCENAIARVKKHSILYIWCMWYVQRMALLKERSHTRTHTHTHTISTPTPLCARKYSHSATNTFEVVTGWEKAAWKRWKVLYIRTD